MDELNLIDDDRPSRADALKNRELLLCTARRMFDKHGIEAVSMSAIAEEAGVGKGTLYRHFKNKLDLCHALLDGEQAMLQARTLDYLRSGDNPLELLRWFLAEVVKFAYQNADLLNVRTGEDGITLLDHPAHIWWRQTIRGLLVQVQPNGDIDYFTDALYILLDARLLQFQRQAGYDQTRIMDGLQAVLLKLIS